MKIQYLSKLAKDHLFHHALLNNLSNFRNVPQPQILDRKERGVNLSLTIAVKRRSKSQKRAILKSKILLRLIIQLEIQDALVKLKVSLEKLIWSTTMIIVLAVGDHFHQIIHGMG